MEIRSLASFVLHRDPAVVLIGEAENGEAAIVIVRQQRPDVVVMDIVMPGIGGLEATRRIKREWPATKVLVPNEDARRYSARGVREIEHVIAIEEPPADAVARPESR